MSHSYLWEFNMKRCCDMQLDTLTSRLEACKEMGIVKNHMVKPDYPAAPNEDYLFDCMNLCATIQQDGRVELEGIVSYWYPDKGNERRTAVIRTFDSLDDCLAWLAVPSVACNECTRVLSEKC